MPTDRFEYLNVRLEAGTITDGELDELESLLAGDYETRERFLDHTQVEGLLHGVAPERAEVEKVVEFSAATEVPRRSNAGWWLAGAAVLIAGIVFTWRVPVEQESITVVVEPTQSEPTILSPEDRYDRSLQSTPRGASLSHPETANSNATATSHGKIEFNRDIRPILSDNCFFCHGPDAAERKADLRLDTEAGAIEDLGGYAAIVKGDSAKSELITRIFDSDHDSIMPPPESKRSLTREQKELLTRWVNEGAEWQKHWAFEPPVRRELPAAREGEWSANPIDRFILSKLEQKALKPSSEASKETLIRRVTLDLTGLPPSLKEVEAFLADDSTNAYGEMVDRLLTSPSYAERMAWQWMDAARYADTDGYQNDGPREMWRWRDWVIDAYRQNMPFDRFTIEQLAGDLLPEPTRDQLIATGFNRNHRYNSEAGLVLEEFLLENAVDRVDTTMTVWTGLTIGCARCHDHKYDPLSQVDYYRMISFFDNITESGRAIKFGNSEPWIKAPTAEQEAEIAEIEYKITEAKKRIARAEPKIMEHQLAWEKSSPDTSEPVVIRGLSDHVIGPIVTNGKERVDVGVKPAGIVPNNRFSIAFEMTPAQVDKGGVLSNEAQGTTRAGFFVVFRDGHLRLAVNTRWIAGAGVLETVQKFKKGERVHIAFTNDGTQRVRGMTVWVNGEKVETRTIHNTNSNTGKGKGTRPLYAGGNKYLSPWEGELRDIRIYSDRVISEGEVAILAEPTSVGDILVKPDRTSREAAKVRDYFLTHAPNRAGHRLRDQLVTLEDEWVKKWDALPTSMVMQEAAEPKATQLRVRGEYHNKGEIVSSGVPAVFPKMSEELPQSRLGLAKWIVSEDNPLVARVTVNRYWQMLFGTGLVKTTEDFGTQGSLPSHPDLLDWLAVEFRHSGWDVRHMLKLMVMSQTYRQSSQIKPEHLAKDPDNAFLARAPRLKLPGNVLRDQALSASGLLVDQIGGASVNPYQPKGLWREASNFTYKVGKGDDLYRRSLYTYWKRTLAPPSMAVLDTADREWCSVKPKRTNTPLQALTLMNETAFFESARKLAEKMLAVESIEDRIDFAFRALMTRKPSADELAILSKSWQKYYEDYESDPELAAGVQKVGESKTNKALDPVELATATAIANVLLNLEEVSVRE